MHNAASDSQHKRGRRTLLTSEVQQRILEAIRAGAYGWVAAQAAGISPKTFYEWLARGEGTDPDRSRTHAYAEFADKVRQAEADARLQAEIAVRRGDPFRWLRYGPGRERPGKPGWTETAERPTVETEVVHKVIFERGPGEDAPPIPGIPGTGLDE